MKQRKPNRFGGYDCSKDELYFVTSSIHDIVRDVIVGTGRDLSWNDGRIIGQVATCPYQDINWNKRWKKANQKI